MDLTHLTIKQAHEGLVKKEFSAVELSQAFINRIEKGDKAIGAYLTVCSQEATSQAKKVDNKISNGETIGLLAGIPVAIKDVISTKGIKTTAGSRVLENYIPPYDAAVVKKLKDEQAVILGKTNCDEFAMGSSTENSAFFVTHNPHDLTRVPGGTSGGSAAAVAAHETVWALGSDTGGSIRQPAALCGVVGLKPTYGLVSRYGLIAVASSLDTIGPITKTVEDAASALGFMAGYDSQDATSTKSENSFAKLLGQGIGKIKVGVPNEFFGEGLDKAVRLQIEKSIKKLESLGAKICPISLPYQKYALAAYYIINPAEISSNMARYDGIRFGGDRELFGQEVKRRIMLGTYVLSAGYYDQYYNKANRVRALIKQDFDQAFAKVDVIVGPTSPTVAWKLGEKVEDPLTMYLSDIYTITANLAGLPAISIPCLPVEAQAKSGGNAEGLPVGLQITGPQMSEPKILQVAYAYEQSK